MGHLLELSSDVIQYLVIRERVMEPLRKSWKMKKIEYFLANINPKCSIQDKAIMFIVCIQPYLITNISLCRALHSFALDHIS